MANDRKAGNTLTFHVFMKIRQKVNNGWIQSRVIRWLAMTLLLSDRFVIPD